MKVYVHLHEDQEHPEKKIVEANTLPRAGEYMSFEWNAESWYQVEAVVRCYYPADFEAEVFAKRVDALSYIHGTGPPVD